MENRAASTAGELSLPEEAVLVKSMTMPADATMVKGYDFDNGVNYDHLLQSFLTSGFQATNFGLAVQEINKMIADRSADFSLPDDVDADFQYPKNRRKTGCTIFLGYTSNLISSGIRETLRFLVKHNLVDCIVTSAGGVEEDLIKCLAPTYIGDFSLKGSDLRQKGLNRIGNLLVPNDNYCKFEDWLMPILDQCLNEQKESRRTASEGEDLNWTPSKLIHRLGKEINHEESVCYWAFKNNIPIFCPGLTDGSLGDMLYFHSYRNPGLRLDIIEDVRHINNMAVKSVRTGSIILGGGLVKHHINNANLMRNGADYAVYVNTGQEFDGSDSGARPDEAVSWGKIKTTATPVKVYADASLVFPLIVAQTFARQTALARE
uniref:deoxyhypusine synthase n=1 Tax=Plectus sambesii TaxID=2011161 RepID=A0A914VRR3_9BILA